MTTAMDRDASKQHDLADEEAVRPLLARANLLRMRGQWDEAVAVCTQALLRAPRSATAHSLLGDIYDAQDKHEDSRQWYRMAVEIDPANAADRAKLDRVVAVQRAQLRTLEIAAASLPSSEPGGDRTLEWFDRIFPPGRPDSVGRLMLALSLSVVAIIALCASFIYVYVTPHHDRPAAASADPLLPAPPVIMTPTIADTGPAERSAAPAPQAKPSAAPVEPLADLRAKLSADLAAGGAQVAGINSAVGAGLALDLVALPLNAEPAEHLRERVIRLCGVAARTVALTASSPVDHLLLRVTLAGAPAPPGAPPAVGGIIFSAAAPLKAFRNFEIADLTQSDLLSRFEFVQWYGPAAIPSVAAPAPSGTPPSAPTPAVASPSPSPAAPPG
jgi:hypothetical protein